jgi:GxxExxY protein
VKSKKISENLSHQSNLWSKKIPLNFLKQYFFTSNFSKMVNETYLHSDLTENIIKAFYKVYNTLGYGFLEKVYENAMLIELRKMGFNAQKQIAINVYYEGELVGEYKADIIVVDKVILELKASESLHEQDEAQLLNYLKATEIEVGLLLNFGLKPQIKRKIFTNDKKPSLRRE